MPKLDARDAAARASNPLGRDFSEALFRGLQIITAFGPSAQAMTLSDVARQVDLPRATVRRSLLTLAHLGYVKEEGRLFSLTPQVLQLAAAYLGASHASAILQPCCERLAAEYGDTFSVAVLDGDSAVMIAYATPRRMYMDAPGIGLRLPAYCSAVGRVLLAALPDLQRESFLERLQPQAVTPRTVTDKAELRGILAQVAAEGFSVAEEEAEIGFRSLAVPVRRVGGAVGFALNTGMHVERRSAEVMRETYLPRLRMEAESLSKQLL
ncbi:MAG: Pca regulon regulatory protein [Gammaproteobacteria bacterium]|nr:Pca regulon regulatory protein [Gammaproteobacteria bacterium]